MIKVVELFSGIGSQTQSLKNIGVEHEVVAIADIDRFANEAYELLHGKTHNLGDITTIDPESVPDHDLLTYSFPCQDLSVAGHQAGLVEGSGTRSSLLWECRKIITIKRPKYLLMENVKNLIGTTNINQFKAWLGELESFGYTSYTNVFNANGFNVPQNRERVFVISIHRDHTPYSFPPVQKLTKSVEDILEENVDDRFYMRQPFQLRERIERTGTGLIHMGDLLMAGNQSIKRVYDPKGVCPTLTTMEGGHRQPKFFIHSEQLIRKLTPRECWKLMGFTDEQFDKVQPHMSNSQLYKQAGNSIVVPVLEGIFTTLFKEGKQ